MVPAGSLSLQLGTWINIRRQMAGRKRKDPALKQAGSLLGLLINTKGYLGALTALMASPVLRYLAI